MEVDDTPTKLCYFQWWIHCFNRYVALSQTLAPYLPSPTLWGRRWLRREEGSRRRRIAFGACNRNIAGWTCSLGLFSCVEWWVPSGGNLQGLHSNLIYSNQTKPLPAHWWWGFNKRKGKEREESEVLLLKMVRNIILRLRLGRSCTLQRRSYPHFPLLTRTTKFAPKTYSLPSSSSLPPSHCSLPPAWYLSMAHYSPSLSYRWWKFYCPVAFSPYFVSSSSPCYPLPWMVGQRGKWWWLLRPPKWLVCSLRKITWIFGCRDPVVQRLERWWVWRYRRSGWREPWGNGWKLASVTWWCYRSRRGGSINSATLTE